MLLRLALLSLDIAPTSDARWYFLDAQNLAEGKGFSESGMLTAFWPVGWPGFLGGLIHVFGPHVIVGQVANLLLSAASIVLTAALANRLVPGNRGGLLAALIIAVYPNQIAYVPLLTVEVFFQFLLLLGFLLLCDGRNRALLMSGLVFGVASLTKSQAILLPSALAMPLLVGHWSKAVLVRWFRILALSGLMMLVVILPWTARNYLIFHQIIPISTNGGFTLLTGNNPSANGGYTTEDPLVLTLPYGPAKQLDQDRIARERALHWIKENPGRFARLIPLKIVALWAGDGEGEWFYQRGYKQYDRYKILFRAGRLVNQIFYLALWALALVNLGDFIRRRNSVSPWVFSGWWVIGYFTLISIVFSGQSRFHYCLMPFVAIYAAQTLAGAVALRWKPLTSGGQPQPTRA